jgi:hypothetical protein
MLVCESHRARVGRELAPAFSLELRDGGVLITFTCASPAARNCQKLAAEQLLHGRRYGPPSPSFHHDTNYDRPPQLTSSLAAGAGRRSVPTLWH